MATPTFPPAEAAEIEKWLWAQREQTAQSWDPDYDHEPVAADGVEEPIVTTGSAVARFLGAEQHREALLGEWQNAHAQVARWQGVQARVLADALDLALADGASRTDSTQSVRSIASELGLAVGVSDRTIEAQMNDAQVLRDRFPQTLAALRDGRISRPHAQVIADEGIRLTDDAARAEYERSALQVATHQTTGRLRAAAKAIAEQLMPTTIGIRHERARALRRVAVRDADDGMAELWALLPAALAHGIHDRLTQFGHTIRDAERDAFGSPEEGESGVPEAGPRTIDQLRADVLCDLLLTGHASAAEIDRSGAEGIDAIRGIVQVSVPLSVLTDPDAKTSAWLAGRGPLDPDSARRLAATATVWDLVFTDPDTGVVVGVDRRFPTEHQRRFLRARDEHCRFPGCRQPVWRCDVDHTVDHQYGGPTTTCNLAHLCRRHHVMKHQTAWQVEQQERGVLVWTSPLGRRYDDKPPSTLRFVPART